MQGIVKRFGSVVANDGINLELYSGEIHALLGENGAGKTTLMNVLYGVHRCDEGRISVKGREVSIRNSTDAQRLGIGMVHQHFSLIPVFTVAENLAIGLKDGHTRLQISKVKEQIERTATQSNLVVDAGRVVEQLSVGEQQRVEILKLLFRGAEVLILDEPTSSLTPQEALDLFATLRTLRKGGKSIVIITHKLYEALDIADRVTVLRKGRVTLQGGREGLTNEALTEAMIGRRIETKGYEKVKTSTQNSMKVEDLVVASEEGKVPVAGVSFEIKAGEILGVAGVAGNGQKELIECLFGLRQARSGRVSLDGVEINAFPIRKRLEAGLCYIPEERKTRAIAIEMELSFNSIMHDHWVEPNVQRGLLNKSAITDLTRRIISKFGVVTQSENSKARSLSGGNLQKFIVGREMIRSMKYLLAVNPTAGLDVGATDDVRKTLVEYRNQGKGILLVSEDLDELLSMCDRMIVIYRGRVSQPVSEESFDKLKIGAMMLGEGFDQKAIAA
jgi:simple sugar transport system ATP-binding protein